MTFDELRLHLCLSVPDEVQVACRKLEERGFSFCGHFGTENAVKILAGMDRAADMGILDEWLLNYMGI